MTGSAVRVLVAISTVLVAACNAPPARTAAAPADEPPRATSEPAAPAASASPAELAMVTSAEAITDDKGLFQLRRLAAGSYRVTFGEPADRAFTQLDGVQVNATYGATLHDLELRSSAASATLGTNEYRPNRRPHIILGNVVSASGAPVSGVRVRATRQ
jgi:hypothetical protein